MRRHETHRRFKLANRQLQLRATFNDEEATAMYHYARGPECPILTDAVPSFLTYSVFEDRMEYITDRILASVDVEREDDDYDEEGYYDIE